MRRLTHIVVLAAFVFSCGGQWGVLQCVAWVNMIHDYSQMVPFKEAVTMTFSGKYPCSICKAIAEKKNSDQQKALSLDKYDKKFISPSAVAIVNPSNSVFQYPAFLSSLKSRIDTPPSPPPRRVLS
jgi:hypothetical protein